MRTTEDLANPLCEFVGAQQTIGLYHLALAVYPLGLYGIVSHGLCLGKRQLTILTPSPLLLTSRL
jgi:hypothetical protein